MQSGTELRRAKVGVTAAFIAHAVVFSSWAAHIPHVKAQLGLSDAALGTALFGGPLGSLAATLLSHWALPRWGSRRLVHVTLAGYAAAGTTVGLAGSGAELFAALALWGFFQGALDVAMNTQAAAVERLARAPIMAARPARSRRRSRAGPLRPAAGRRPADRCRVGSRIE